MIKGGASVVGYGIGGALKGAGHAFNSVGSTTRGGSLIFAGDGVQTRVMTGVEGFGIAGTGATTLATAADVGYNLKVSYGCRKLLSDNN